MDKYICYRDYKVGMKGKKVFNRGKIYSYYDRTPAFVFLEGEDGKIYKFRSIQVHYFMVDPFDQALDEFEDYFMNKEEYRNYVINELVDG